MDLNENLNVELKKLSDVIGIERIEYFNSFLSLQILDIDDTEGYKQVYDALRVVKKERGKLEKVRKELKKDALEYGRAVDTKAKELNALLEPIETHLAFERGVIDDQVAKIKRKKEMDEDVSAVWDQANDENVQFDFQLKEKIRLEEQRVAQEKRENQLRAKEEEIARKERENQIRFEEQEKAKMQVKEAEARIVEESRIKMETEQEIEKARQQKEQEEVDKKFAEEKRKLELAPDKEKIEAYLASITSIKLPNLINNNLSVILVNVVEDFTIILKNILRTNDF
jgi:DNA repair exonuclease SbcCD ATPase subunit